ncbi:MAG: IS4 family transposase [Moorea sp. SIO2I5]|nr:IS4 family transposase [Moorena sp. SIO2I5]
MLPPFYQRVLEKHLSQKQCLQAQLLVLMLPSFRQVKLSTLASVFPQPITYESRVRNLQRFLEHKKWNVKLLWFPIIKYWLRQEYRGYKPNREQRRRVKKLRNGKSDYVLLALDRTQWKGRNLIVVSVIWNQYALPIYWEEMHKKGSSDLARQKAVLKPVLKLMKSYPVIVIGDREFHSAKLGIWLCEKGVDFILRQKKSACIQQFNGEYKSLKKMGFKPGDTEFFQGINCHKELGLGSFNLAVRWKRKYRGKQPSDCWYLLTSLPNLKQTLISYRKRWGIESMFKHCKTGGYNLEQTRVNSVRLLALVLLIAFAYTLSTLEGYSLQNTPLAPYSTRIHKQQQFLAHHSDFTIGLFTQAWVNAMTLWSELALALMLLKPHKRLYFQRGLQALSSIRQSLERCCHP